MKIYKQNLYQNLKQKLMPNLLHIKTFFQIFWLIVGVSRSKKISLTYQKNTKKNETSIESAMNTM